VSAKPISYCDLRHKEIEALENDVFGFVLHPEKHSVFVKLDSEKVHADLTFRAEEPVLALSMDALKVFQGLVEIARGGDKNAIGVLANQATLTIHFLNELAEQNGKAATAMKKVAARSRVWPQLLGRHPDELKKSRRRIKEIGLGDKVIMKTGFSDLPAEDQLWRAIIGGYIHRLSTSIRRVRLQGKSFNLDLKKGVELPKWICEALELSKTESVWCSFALRLLKMMNGGSYPADFIKRGESNAKAYTKNVSPTAGNARKNQSVIAAEKAFRKAWQARF
jgi:hypothetical protein